MQVQLKPKILLIEDHASTRFGYQTCLSGAGYDVSEAEDLAAADRQLALQRFDAVIIDIHLPDGSGLDLIDRLRQESPDIAIIIITGAGDVPLAVDAMRRGADNFLIKPVDMQGLEVFLKKNLEIGTMRRLHSSQQRLRDREDIFFGVSRAMEEIQELVRVAAESDAPVLLTGETGTGKGCLAKWIHRNSRRARYNFVDVNCSCLSGDLLARELFGNVRGAFTSAERDREGLMDVADRGTLFLDEIGEMDGSVQSRFLKVLEDKTYRRLGDTKLRQSDFRLISATNRLIFEEVGKGTFRDDLLYRINILTIHVPPLRERMEDLPGLVRHLLKNGKTTKSEITEQALQELRRYSWPGNIRELRNVLERASLLAPGKILSHEHLAWLKDSPAGQKQGGNQTLEQLERDHIQSIMERFQGDVSKAARILGISRATLYRKIKEEKPSSD